MENDFREQWSPSKSGNFEGWSEAFLQDCRIRGLKQGTVYFYASKFSVFREFLREHNQSDITAITPEVLRAFLASLTESGHNAGGVHAFYRSLRTFFRWYENEAEPANWRSPLRNIKPPTVPEQRLAPVELGVVRKMIDTCDTTLLGLRDNAIMTVLLDTGMRASELIALNITDINLVTGIMFIGHGKGDKPRTVVAGKKTRKAIRNYLRARNDNHPAFILSDTSERLTYWGLNLMLKRRAELARVPKPQLHAFRRAFALECLRAGMNVYSLQRLMGHADLSVLKRYLALTDEDLIFAHSTASPVDNGGF